MYNLLHRCSNFYWSLEHNLSLNRYIRLYPPDIFFNPWLQLHSNWYMANNSGRILSFMVWVWLSTQTSSRKLDLYSLLLLRFSRESCTSHWSYVKNLWRLGTDIRDVIINLTFLYLQYLSKASLMIWRTDNCWIYFKLCSTSLKWTILPPSLVSWRSGSQLKHSNPEDYEKKKNCLLIRMTLFSSLALTLIRRSQASNLRLSTKMRLWLMEDVARIFRNVIYLPTSWFCTFCLLIEIRQTSHLYYIFYK